MQDIRYMIIEDEHILGKRLERLVSELRPSYTMVERTAGVEETCELLPGLDLDLIFMDIELADGNCFEIFDSIDVKTPVIFTTAYDEYALQAFRVNSVDYLLKPVNKENLLRAIEKFEANHLAGHASQLDYKALAEELRPKQSRERRIVSRGNSFMFVPLTEVAWFFSDGKYCELSTFSGKSYIIDDALGKLEEELDGKRFFRVSRSCILNIDAIVSIERHSAGRLKVTANPAPGHPVIVSQARREHFLKWLEGV